VKVSGGIYNRSNHSPRDQAQDERMLQKLCVQSGHLTLINNIQNLYVYCMAKTLAKRLLQRPGLAKKTLVNVDLHRKSPIID